jgi:putative DNA primase/helicase
MTRRTITQFADTEFQLEDAFFNLHGKDYRYTESLGHWRIWNGQYWEKDETSRTFDRVRGVCSDAAAAAYDAKTRRRLSRAQTVDAVEKLARYDQRDAATVDQWDRDPWLLSTPGGVVDLHTGTLRPARREDYMTKTTACAPGGDYPRWRSFLSRITDGDEGLQRYLQKMAGYALTGVTKELFVRHGCQRKVCLSEDDCWCDGRLREMCNLDEGVG